MAVATAFSQNCNSNATQLIVFDVRKYRVIGLQHVASHVLSMNAAEDSFVACRSGMMNIP